VAPIVIVVVVEAALAVELYVAGLQLVDLRRVQAQDLPLGPKPLRSARRLLRVVQR